MTRRDEPAREDAASLYIDLLQRSLTNTLYEDRPNDPWSGEAYSASRRDLGRDWPSQAVTMIGSKRMENLRSLCELVIERKIPGDFIETGVWRGGACIFMRGILKAHGINNRRVFVADSFEGAPPPTPGIAADAGDEHHLAAQLRVSAEQVRGNFEKFGLLDDQVVFIKGWFSDTLASAPIERLAILRLDGDLYGSTMDALDALYHKLSPGGFVIVDDYGAVPGCRMAVHDFRKQHNITSAIQNIDGQGVFWKKDETPKAVERSSPNLRIAARPVSTIPHPKSWEQIWAKHKDRHCIWIVTPRGYSHHHAYDEFALGLSDAFHQLGGSAPMVWSRNEWGGRAPIIVAALLLKNFPIGELPEESIAVSLEPVSVGSPWFSPGYLEVLTKFPVFDFNQRNMSALHELGVDDTHLLQVGYSPKLSRIVMSPEPDIDILFMARETKDEKNCWIISDRARLTLSICSMSMARKEMKRSRGQRWF